LNFAQVTLEYTRCELLYVCMYVRTYARAFVCVCVGVCVCMHIQRNPISTAVIC